ncbi:MAG TPA: isoprenylcysteine carboxylmethyltransferase family protein [Ktedonobacterales bacterium]|jgi:protein-S-isoprenylcysteine O-methyltransferase Ste14|nr:isoprenylcysteine carboxylmethyltransferase family protein [Ktedonobacterales bacterium]
MLPLPCTRPLYAVAFIAAVTLVLALELPRLANNRARAGMVARDGGSLVVLLGLLVLGSIGALICATLLPDAALRWGREPIFWAGIALMLLGAAFRAYAIRVLGRYFIVTVAIGPDQPVIDAGPYRYIRHPAYSGALLALLGVGLTLTNWASLAVLVICNLVGFAYRVAVEEQALREVLGPPYIAYMGRTRRFIPFVF